MLPLLLLCKAHNKPILVELKNGETYNGLLVNSDNFMNISLAQVTCTSADGNRFFSMPECSIKGSTVKFMRIPDEVIHAVLQERLKRDEARRAPEKKAPKFANKKPTRFSKTK